MEMKYNAYFLKQEAEMAKEEIKLKAILEPQVEAQLATQMEAVCAFMRPRLIAAWENGDLGERIGGEVFLSIPREPLSQTYVNLLNTLVREKLGEYGFTAYFNCQKTEHPEIAKVHFNFTQSFYEKHKDWCASLAQEYFDEKVRSVENTLHQVLYLHNLSCSQGKENPFGDKVEVTVKFPPALRQRLGKRVCDEIGESLKGYDIADLDKVIFELATK